MIVTAKGMRLAVEATLKAHLPYALTVIGDQDDTVLTAPKSWRRLADFTTDLTESLSPTVVVTCQGIEGLPETRSDYYDPDDGEELSVDDVWWLITVFVVAMGRTYEETTDRVAGMVAAIRATLNSYPSLGGLSADADWIGENYDELTRNEKHTIGAGSVNFRFLVPTERVLPDPSPTFVEIDGVTVTFDVDLTGGATP